MSLKKVARFRDNLHGSIDVTDLEMKVINHKAFQRLRHIKQTAFLSLAFPGATHTRFEHSLGVMFLAEKAWYKLYDNQISLHESWLQFQGAENRGSQISENKEFSLSPTFSVMSSLFNSDYVLQALRLAALMHDIGHPPYSHTGEVLLPNYQELIDSNQGIPEYLKIFLETKKTAEKQVSHEVYTLLLVEKIFRDIAVNSEEDVFIKARDIISIIEPEITPELLSPLTDLCAHDLCHELISGDIDIDRMDYLIRDSRECGVAYGIYDMDRILDSLVLYHDSSDQTIHLAINYSGLAAFEDYLRARQSMYLQLYFHKCSTAAEAMLKFIFSEIKGWSLPSNLDAYLAINDYNLQFKLKDYVDEKIKNEKNKKSLHQTIDHLFSERKLWKRIYEVTHDDRKDAPLFDSLKQELSKKQIPFYSIVSSVCLSKGRASSKNIKKNHLKLVKKSDFSGPKIENLENYSSLIGQNQEIRVERIYVESQDAKDKILLEGVGKLGFFR